MSQTATISHSVAAPRRRGGSGDAIFAAVATASGVFVLVLLGAIIISLFVGGWPSFREFGAAFLVNVDWDPVQHIYGAAVPIYGTIVTSIIALVLAVPLAFGIAFFLTELAPSWMRRPIGTAVELLAAVPSIIYGMWGFFVIVPAMADWIQPPVIDTLDGIPVLQDLFAGPPFGTGLFTAALILAVMIVPFIAATMRDVFLTVPPVFKESAYGVGCTTWEVMRSVVIPYTRISVVGGVMLGLGRALGETMAVTFVIGKHQPHHREPVRLRQHDRLAGGAGIRRERVGQPETVVAAGARVHPVRHFVHRAGDLAVAAAPEGRGMRRHADGRPDVSRPVPRPGHRQFAVPASAAQQHRGDRAGRAGDADRICCSSPRSSTRS